jgi:DnaJ-domain-containing protein 1
VARDERISRPSVPAQRLEEPVIDLPAEKRARVDAMYAQLGTLDHYQLLGVPYGADKKTIKRAYFTATNEYHPDRFFRKELGGYKAKLEAIFARVSVAYETLNDEARRAEYDASLGSDRVRSVGRMVEEAAAEMARERESGVRDELPPARPVPVAGASARPPVASAPPRVSSAPPLDAQARRDALARRLLGGTPNRSITPVGVRAVGSSARPPSPPAASPSGKPPAK